jgi:hypothetical protein
VLILASVTAAAFRGQAVQWSAFAPGIAMCFAMIGIGLYVRHFKPAPRIALGTIGLGVFMAFSAIVSILAYTIFPFVNPMIDQRLVAWDAQLGFSWLGFLESMAAYPLISKALGYIYLTSLPQIMGLIALLSYLNRPTELHRFLLVGFVTMFFTLAFWWAFPSVGPTAYFPVPPALEAQLGLMTNTQSGANLLRWATDGNAIITPDIVTGVVAFPSFHIVMACMVVWFSWRTVVFVPTLLVNLAMIPATILQGGHHLVDIVAGIGTFGLCLWLTCKLVPRPTLALKS